MPYVGLTGATDLAPGPNGSLWVTDERADAFYRCVGGTCEQVVGAWSAPYGVATTGSGDVCVAHRDGDDPLTSRTRITCLRDGEARVEIEGIGHGIRGLASAPEGVWAAVWHDSPAMGREGELLLVAAGEVRRRVPLSGGWPQHLVEHPEGGLLVSVWRTDGAGFSGAEIVRVDEDGRVESFSDALVQPSGLAFGAGATWIADHATGELVRLDPGGQPTTVLEGLSSPLGLAFRDLSTLCIASSAPEPLQCFSVQALHGGNP
jgi:hypothetical protein